MNAKAQQVLRAGLVGLIMLVLMTALAACSQSSPTDIGGASENCVLIRDQIYCP